MNAARMTFERLEGAWAETLSPAQPVARFAHNPILTCHAVNAVWSAPSLQVKTVHNAGIVQHDGGVAMLFRAHLRCGVSVIGLARSRDGLTNWTVDPQPALLPCTAADPCAEGLDRDVLCANEGGGVEDPRITSLDGTCYVTYSAYHGTIKDRVRVSLATSQDLRAFVRHGPVLDRDMRNVVIFPRQIAGRYWGLFRPNQTGAAGDIGGTFSEVLIGSCSTLTAHEWTIFPEPVFRTGGGPGVFADKIGPGAPPIETPHGWVNIFHGVRGTMDGHPYSLGVALHDAHDPRKVEVSALPLMLPTRSDCRVGEYDYVHVPHVVFTCGALRRADGTILIYYGGNDTVMNVALTHENVLAEMCRSYPMDPATGCMAYELS